MALIKVENNNIQYTNRAEFFVRLRRCFASVYYQTLQQTVPHRIGIHRQNCFIHKEIADKDVSVQNKRYIVHKESGDYSKFRFFFLVSLHLLRSELKRQSKCKLYFLHESIFVLKFHKNESFLSIFLKINLPPVTLQMSICSIFARNEGK